LTVSICAAAEEFAAAGGTPFADVASAGGINVKLKFACRTGVPVSLVTTRPRMLAVPVGSGGG
jgi:hypothetical protein